MYITRTSKKARDDEVYKYFNWLCVLPYDHRKLSGKQVKDLCGLAAVTMLSAPKLAMQPGATGAEVPGRQVTDVKWEPEDLHMTMKLFQARLLTTAEYHLQYRKRGVLSSTPFLLLKMMI